MKAVYQSKSVYIHHISITKEFVIVSYSEEEINLFKVDIKDLTNLDEILVKELEKREH